MSAASIGFLDLIQYSKGLIKYGWVIHAFIDGYFFSTSPQIYTEYLETFAGITVQTILVLLVS